MAVEKGQTLFVAENVVLPFNRVDIAKELIDDGWMKIRLFKKQTQQNWFLFEDTLKYKNP